MTSSRAQIRFSIVVSVYNGGNELSRSLRPLLRSKSADWELIIVNDGSTDSTAEIASELCRSDSRLRLLTNDTNMGLARARIIGTKSAKGEYVTFLDAGDRIYPEVISNILDEACSHSPDIILAGCNLLIPFLHLNREYHNPATVDIFHDKRIVTSPSLIRALHLELLRGNIIPNLFNKLFRRELITKHLTDNYEYHIGEDYNSCARLFPVAQSFYCSPLTVYQWRYSGMGAKYYLKGWDEYCKGLEVTVKAVEDIYADNAMHRQEAVSAMAELYFYNLREAYIQRLLRHRERGFLDSVKTGALHKCMSRYLPEWSGLATTDIDEQALKKLALRQIKRHWKHYTISFFYSLLHS